MKKEDEEWDNAIKKVYWFFHFCNSPFANVVARGFISTAALFILPLNILFSLFFLCWSVSPVMIRVCEEYFNNRVKASSLWLREKEKVKELRKK